MTGLGLLLAHPELPSCEDCLAWLYNIDTWRQDERGGKPVARPPWAPPPCNRCPKGKLLFPPQPNPDAELSLKNRRALAVYCHVKGGAVQPNDEIVRRNCALIRMVEDAHQRAQLSYLNLSPLVSALTRVKR